MCFFEVRSRNMCGIARCGRQTVYSDFKIVWTFSPVVMSKIPGIREVFCKIKYNLSRFNTQYHEIWAVWPVLYSSCDVTRLISFVVAVLISFVLLIHRVYFSHLLMETSQVSETCIQILLKMVTDVCYGYIWFGFSVLACSIHCCG